MKSFILTFLLIKTLLIFSLLFFMSTASAEDMPDLIIQDIVWDPSSPKTEDDVTFTVTYKNQGTLSAGNSFYICLYVDDSRIKYNTVNDLSADTSGTTTFTWNVGRDVSDGDHSVSAYVDMSYSSGNNARITESNELNNEKELDFSITKIYTYADLTITVVDGRNSNFLESAEVSINGDIVGHTDSDGKVTKKVAEGEKHIIKVVKLDYYSKIETIGVYYDVGVKKVTIRLDYAKIPIIIKVEDENGNAACNAEVLLDDVNIGITDIEGEVVGEATKNKDVMLKVVKSGYYTENALIHVGSYKKSHLIKLKLEDKAAPNIIIEKMEIVGDNDDILEVGECIKITYSVHDDSGIKEIKCKLGGNLIDSYTSTGTYSSTTPHLTIGTHIIEFEAIDADIDTHKSNKDVSIIVSEKGPIVLFQSTKNTIDRGENAVFTLGALNPIGRENMTVELIFKAPSGVSISDISFIKSGSGMYQATFQIEPGEAMKFITLTLIGNELGMHKIEADVHYSVPDGEVMIQHETLTLNVIDKSIKNKETNPTSEQGSSGLIVPGFEVLIAITCLIVVVYFLGKRE